MTRLSIIIATGSGAEVLAPTLRSISANVFPAAWEVELLLVESGGPHGAPAALRDLPPHRLQLRCLQEPLRGKSRALNLALSQARGEIALFTDDDVRVPPDWIERLSAPIRTGTAGGVVGWVEMAPHLRRPWMQRLHRAWLASTADYLDPEDPSELIGANMAVPMRALREAGGFDPELGPGVTNGGEESLLSWQLRRAGHRLVALPDVVVEHHFSASRLLYPAWLRAATLKGESRAYLDHHWHHRTPRRPALRARWLEAKLWSRRRCTPRPGPGDEGIAAWELSYVEEIAACRRFLREQPRTRHYPGPGIRHLTPALSLSQ
jgi:glycosyltransferase involved in cell wall biosynthesis